MHKFIIEFFFYYKNLGEENVVPIESRKNLQTQHLYKYLHLSYSKEIRGFIIKF